MQEKQIKAEFILKRQFFDKLIFSIYF